MGSLVSELCELLVGYYSVSPSSGLIDVASTVGINFNTVKTRLYEPTKLYFGVVIVI